MGNAHEFGDIGTACHSPGGASSSTRGCIAGGRSPSLLDNIEYVTIATQGDAVNFGDLTEARANVAGFSNAHGGL